MLIMIGVWKINLDLKKPTEINSDNYSNLNLPPFPKLEEELGELNKGVDKIEKINKEELFEKNKEDVKEGKTEEELEV